MVYPTYVELQISICISIVFICWPLVHQEWYSPSVTLYSRILYFRVNSRKHCDAKIKSSPIISNKRIIEQGMANRVNKVSWIYPGKWPRENKVTRIISVLQKVSLLYSSGKSLFKFLLLIILMLKIVISSKLATQRRGKNTHKVLRALIHPFQTLSNYAFQKIYKLPGFTNVRHRFYDSPCETG